MTVPMRTPTNEQEYRKEKNKLYYQQHKEEIQGRHRKYYQENKEAIRQRQLERNPDHDKQQYLARRDYLTEKVECQFCKSIVNRKFLKDHHNTKKCKAFQ